MDGLRGTSDENHSVEDKGKGDRCTGPMNLSVHVARARATGKAFGRQETFTNLLYLDNQPRLTYMPVCTQHTRYKYPLDASPKVSTVAAHHMPDKIKYTCHLIMQACIEKEPSQHAWKRPISIIKYNKSQLFPVLVLKYYCNQLFIAIHPNIHV